MTIENLICTNCKHQQSFGCKAFPDGIPDEILISNEHNKPIKDQDNSIIFEPIPTIE